MCLWTPFKKRQKTYLKYFNFHNNFNVKLQLSTQKSPPHILLWVLPEWKYSYLEFVSAAQLYSDYWFWWQLCVRRLNQFCTMFVLWMAIDHYCSVLLSLCPPWRLTHGSRYYYFSVILIGRIQIDLLLNSCNDRITVSCRFQ